MESSDASPPASYARLAAVLFFSVILGFSFGIFFYRQWIYDQRMSNDANLNTNPAASSRAVQTPSTIFTESRPAPSSLTFIPTGPMGNSAATSAQSGQDLTAAVRNNESRVRALAIEYTRKYPVIRQYGQDWAHYPDLHQFNLEYNKDHDPIKFAYHVSSSSNFAALVKKYAERPEILGFVEDVVKTTPSELFVASREFLSQDNHAADLLRRFTSAIGLPDSLMAGLASGAASPDQAASALKTDPKFRQFLQQGNVNPNNLNGDFNNQR